MSAAGGKLQRTPGGADGSASNWAVKGIELRKEVGVSVSGKRIAILVEALYEELELWYPRLRLIEAGADVVVVGTNEHAEYRGMRGHPIMADVGLHSAVKRCFDALLIPGGYAPDHMRCHPGMKDLVARAYATGAIIAAIDQGPRMLASRPETIRGRTVTGSAAIEDDLRNAGANYVHEEVVVDGPIITSRGSADLPVFMRAVIDALETEQAVLGHAPAGTIAEAVA